VTQSGSATCATLAGPPANLQGEAKNFTFSLPFLYQFLILAVFVR
jgi:hypothetical protein